MAFHSPREPMGYIDSMPEEHPNTLKPLIRKKTGEPRERLIFEKLWKPVNGDYGGQFSVPVTSRKESKVKDSVWCDNSWETTYDQYGKHLDDFNYTIPLRSSSKRVNQPHKGIEHMLSPRPHKDQQTPYSAPRFGQDDQQIGSSSIAKAPAPSLGYSQGVPTQRVNMAGMKRRLGDPGAVPRGSLEAKPYNRLPPLVDGRGAGGAGGKKPYALTGLGRASLEHKLGDFWNQARNTNIH